MNNIIVPPSIARDQTVQQITEVITHELTGVETGARRLAILAHLKTLDVAVLDLLAYQWHVDFYDASWDKDTKADALATSVAWHRIKGTPAAVELATSRVCEGATVVEAWEYGGLPYHFKVKLITSPLIDAVSVDKILTLIEKSKNARSHIDGIGYDRRLPGTVYTGGAVRIRRRVLAYPANTEIPNPRAVTYTGGGLIVRKGAVVHG